MCRSLASAGMRALMDAFPHLQNEERFRGMEFKMKVLPVLAHQHWWLDRKLRLYWLTRPLQISRLLCKFRVVQMVNCARPCWMMGFTCPDWVVSFARACYLIIELLKLCVLTYLLDDHYFGFSLVDWETDDLLGRRLLVCGFKWIK